MSQYELNKIKIDQMHLALKDVYTLVISANYTQDIYSVIDSKISNLSPCDNVSNFKKFATEYFGKCHPEDLQSYPLVCDFDSLIDHLKNNKGYYAFQVRLEKQPYLFNWYEGKYFLVNNPENDDVLLLFLFKDINNSKIIEENLKDAFLANEIAAKAKTDFLSRMSNDLRTPISLIVSMIDLARNNIDDKEKIMDSLVKMDISSRYLFQLIDNILDMSKLEAGKFSIDNSPFNIIDVLDEVKAAYTALADSNSILFDVQEHTKGMNNLIGDAFRIKQVLKNLISNSFKYTPFDGIITVELLLNKVVYNRAFFSFIIKNDGPPLDETQIDRLFKPFEKGHISEQPQHFEGLGLGLSLCKNTIELLGGAIRGSNNPDGTGVIFEVDVSFELDEENSPDEIDFLEDNAYIRFPKRNILIAEDDEKNYETIKALLESREMTVDLAINGLEAVQAFEQSPSGHYDLLLMEIDLPIMSGLDATQAIRNSFCETGSTIPIVGMSVDVLDKKILQALEAGMNAHIPKPIDVNKLFATLKNYI